ncbi:MAG TPA: SUMF1/EgtB/PvdO family nonheme iron enzyme [Bacteroidia bacterium]|jgi:formylglycine-generating enzyme required for sulfatase activity|nr:SUMF1/EgtB/PvdO family nonheme iron enzyme [Bacteroidia bacterium]
MKRLLFVGVVAVMLLSSCEQDNGQLMGVQNRPAWYPFDPYGMLYCPMGSYNMGPSDEDIPYAHTTKSKTVSVQAFYMDQTEISNNEYRQFVYYVRDSLARRLLATNGFDEQYLIPDGEWQGDDDAQQPTYIADDRPQDPYAPLNWLEKVHWDATDPEYKAALNDMYLPAEERFWHRKEIDTRKLIYEYYRIDLRTAAQKTNRYIPKTTPNPSEDGRVMPTTDRGNYNVTSRRVTKNGVDRSVFIVKDVINVYPDTLAWVHDFSYSFNEPMTNMYFWHPCYDDYPVVGITWKQARAFCIWRTQLLTTYAQGTGQLAVNDFRLPTESEWEYGARGGLQLSPFPWGGPYIRNARGCFLGNFKPMRGSYIDDGGFHTVKIFSYNPNDWGFYCMAGNAAEWTSCAFDESAYDFMHDLNPDYQYETTVQDESPGSTVLCRKVIRGGSWKDVGFYLQTSSRTYEYQDTAKCYVGFRCVMTFLGRSKDDDL